MWNQHYDYIFRFNIESKIFTRMYRLKMLWSRFKILPINENELSFCIFVILRAWNRVPEESWCNLKKSGFKNQPLLLIAFILKCGKHELIFMKSNDNTMCCMINNMVASVCWGLAAMTLVISDVFTSHIPMSWYSQLIRPCHPLNSLPSEAACFIGQEIQRVTFSEQTMLPPGELPVLRGAPLGSLSRASAARGGSIGCCRWDVRGLRGTGDDN